MTEIPVTFTHEGKEYNGVLEEMHGGTNWYLIIDKSYYGSLVFTHYGFIFHPQLDKYNWMKELSEYFGEIVTLWHQ